MKELGYFFCKPPPERQAIAIDLGRALVSDQTLSNDRLAFSEQAESADVAA
jgi:hypothetical protein